MLSFFVFAFVLAEPRGLILVESPHFLFFLLRFPKAPFSHPSKLTDPLRLGTMKQVSLLQFSLNFEMPLVHEIIILVLAKSLLQLDSVSFYLLYALVYCEDMLPSLCLLYWLTRLLLHFMEFMLSLASTLQSLALPLMFAE